jgi:predicted MFS family arabinose efflux permease
MSPVATSKAVPFTGYQKFIVGILAFLQFTIVLDFMILSPLGALLMQELKLPAARFGLVVSVYAFSAGASGLLAAGFADRFDRKRLLLFFYTGFVLGTFFCALAPSYPFLLAARMITGFFGGVIGSISFAIIADLFPPEARGRVMGIVQTAFAASQVLGIPVSLLLANRWGWHAPFFFIVAVSTVVGVVIALKMRPIDGHLALERPGNPFRHLFKTVSRGDYARAFACTIVLVTGGFMLMPFGSAFIVHNVSIPMESLPIIYMVTGLVSIVGGPLVGRLSDAVGKYAVFCVGSAVGAALVVVFTNLGPSPLWLVTAVNVVLMLAVSSRIISASALVSIVPDAPDRGAFMAVNSSIQQISGGVASAAAGLVVTLAPSGELQHYDSLGYVVVVSMGVAVALLYSINRIVNAKLAAPPAVPARTPTAA